MGIVRSITPVSRAGTRTADLDGDITEGDFFIEYWPGHPASIYRAERGRLVRMPFSREQALTTGSISDAIAATAANHGQHHGVIFELKNGDFRQIGNVLGNGDTARVVWSPTKSHRSNPPGVLRADSRVRYETKWKVGEPGAVYEFNVKFHRGDYSADVDDESLYIETQHAVEAFEDVLRDRFPWVGAVHLTGRSGGWLAVEDKQGKATAKRITEIADMVDDAREEFGKYLDEQYGGSRRRRSRR